MKILLISGHGAGDCGATGNGYQEYALTRELVNLIAPKLRSHATVDVYNQNRNAFKDCENGAFKVSGYDYVFEVHFNAYNGQAHGTECFVVSRESGIVVEQSVMKRMGKYFTLRDNDSVFDGVKRTNFLVINTVKDKGMSGALLETCFIDNASDIGIYQSNKDNIATDIVEGIVEGFGLGSSEYTPVPTPPTPEAPSTPSASLNYGEGTPVCVEQLNTQSNGGELVPSHVEGVIGRIIQGATYPYRVDRNGTPIGWVNDAIIDADKHIPGATQPSAPQPTASTVTLPASAATWRAYRTDVAPVVGNECGFLAPAQYGGLTYEIIGRPQSNVVTINTGAFGTVNIYVGADTGAILN